MCLHALDEFAVPADTAEAARTALPKGNVYTKMRDELGVLYRDSDFAALFGVRGQPAESPGRLALVTILQFAEGLTDRQAAEAVATRIDWKYVLGLAVGAPSFHHSVLGEFRLRLLTGGAEQQLLDRLLERFREQGLIRARGRQRTDSTHILAAIRVLNRLECVGEALRRALEEVAAIAPDWLLAQITLDWFDRYSSRFEQQRLPKEKAERQALALTLGQDGYHLLSAVYAAQAPAGLRTLPGVEILRRIWLQQYYLEAGQVHWREAGNTPPAALMIESPYDAEAHFARKRATEWVGYKGHLTETCDDDLPQVITHVATTPATQADTDLPALIHRELAAKDLLPQEHLLDAGYVDAGNLVASQARHGVDLIGPVRADTTVQGRMGQGFALACFAINWEAKTVTCPQGCRSRVWSESQDRVGNPTIEVRFDKADCATCASRSQCTTAASGPRCLKLREQAQHEALQAARQRQATPAFWQAYAKRAGVEGTISQACAPFGLRQTRYIGLAKTHLQNLAIAAAINLQRVVAWLNGKPRAPTRTSRFAALKAVWPPYQMPAPVATAINN
jgi:transposase